VLAAVALASGEPEVAVRDGGVLARRLGRPAGALAVPGGGVPWRLEVTEQGTLDGLATGGVPGGGRAAGAGQVRVAVRAAGVNFRDVLIGLGMYPGEPVLGSEAAGVVLEAGPGVTGLAPGDRVTGLVDGGFGPVAVADARQLVRVPGGVVVRAGGGGAGGVRDGVVRAGGPGRAAAGSGCSSTRRPAGSAPRRWASRACWGWRCSRPRARASTGAAGDGLRRGPHRLVP
jgi:hypothetical protein